jgi:hypothetical protein
MMRSILTIVWSLANSSGGGVALAAVEMLENELDAPVGQRPAALGAEERQHLPQMGTDLEAAWQHPMAT